MSVKQQRAFRLSCYVLAVVVYCGAVVLHNTYESSQQRLADKHAKELHELMSS